MNLSDNLKKIRRDNNLSQEQLAEKLGVSRQSVSKWESGLAYPEMDKVLQICQLFNLNVDELLNQNIKEVKETKESKANINKFIDDFLNFITKTVDMFSSMRFKEKIKCLFEQIIVCLILAIIFVIIGALGAFLLSSIFKVLPTNLYYNLSGIVWTFYIVFAIIAGIVILLHIFKVRYLDYYIIVTSDNEDIDNTSSKNIDDSKDSIKVINKDEKNYIEKKNQKIVIRDPNHSPYRFISGLLKCVLFFIKLFAIFAAILFCISLIFLVISLVLSIIIFKSGILFIGVFIVIISSIVLNLLLLYIIYNFILSKKSKKNILAIIFIISIILIGIGTGFITIAIKDFNYIDDFNSEYYIDDEKIIDMRDDLIIYNNIGDIQYVESDNTNIRIVCKHSKYYIFKINNYYTNDHQDENMIYVDLYENTSNLMQQLRENITNLNNKEIVNYSKSKVYIYTSKENIEKLRNNLKKQREKEKKEEIEAIYNSYENRISELLDSNEEKENKILDLENELNNKENEIQELKDTLNNYINSLQN